MRVDAVARSVRTDGEPTVEVPPFARRGRESPGTWRTGWTSAPGTRTALALPPRWRGPARVELIDWTGSGLVLVGAVAVDEATSAVAVSSDMRIAAIDMDWSPHEERPTRLAICEADRAPTLHELRLGSGRGWPRAARWTPAGDLLVLVEDDDSLLALVDPRSGVVIAETVVESAMCDGGWIDGVERGTVIVRGHCACQENDFELAALTGRELEGLDWLVHAREGCAIVDVDETSVLSIENDPSPVVRRRDRATGRVLAANVLADDPAAFSAIRCRTETGHLVVAHGRDGPELVHLDRDTLEIDDSAELGEATVPLVFVEDGLLLAELDDRLEVLRVST